VEMGAEVPESWARQTFSIPEAKNGEKILRPASAAQPVDPLVAAARRSAHAANIGAKKDAFPDQVALDGAVDGIPSEDLKKMMDTVLKPVLELIQGSADYADIYAKLAGVFPDMDTRSLEELLARCYFAAEVYGRLSGQAENA